MSRLQRFHRILLRLLIVAAVLGNFYCGWRWHSRAAVLEPLSSFGQDDEVTFEARVRRGLFPGRYQFYLGLCLPDAPAGGPQRDGLSVGLMDTEAALRVVDGESGRSVYSHRGALGQWQIGDSPLIEGCNVYLYPLTPDPASLRVDAWSSYEITLHLAGGDLSRLSDLRPVIAVCGEEAHRVKVAWALLGVCPVLALLALMLVAPVDVQLNEMSTSSH